MTVCCFLSSQDFITAAFLMPEDKLRNVLHKVSIRDGGSTLLIKHYLKLIQSRSFDPLFNEVTALRVRLI